MTKTRSILVAVPMLVAAMAATGATAETAAEHSLLMQRQGAADLLRGKFDRAIQAYDEALVYDKLAPANRANILSDRGVAHWRMNRTDLALADFQQAIQLNPQYAQVYNNMGNVLMDSNRLPEAIEAYGKAIDSAPTYGVAFNNRGNAHFELGNTDAAIADFDQAVRYLPLNAVPLNGRGRARLSFRLHYAALRDFSRAVQLNSSYSMVFLSRARALAGIGEYRDAIKDFNEAIDRAREEPQLYFERGQAYLAASDYGPATADFTRAIDLAPGNALAYAQRGVCYGLSRGYDRAFADLDKAVELDPTSPAVFLARAKVLKRKGDVEKAMVDLNTVVELDKNNAEALKLMAQIHEIKNDKEQAKDFYQRSLAIDPFLEGSREGLRRLTGTLPPYAAASGSEPVSGWKLARLADGRYYAANDSYPYLHADLEMYGEGEPKLLEWVPGTGNWKGVGELRYQAGTRNENGTVSTLVYAAIVDVKNGKLAAIEPFSWGDRQSKWRWGNGSVFITDPDGMTSKVSLRAPSANGPRNEEDEMPSATVPLTDVVQPERRSVAATRRPAAVVEQQRRQQRQQSKSLLDWIFE